ncbi:MAG: ferrous iron transport protein A [Deltaproteobacteria bacterium]|nr:ferrous iron transport protein A [Deltaproteobacteria bacterium]
MDRTLTLNKLGAGSKAVVCSVCCKNKSVGGKLLAMGVVAGTIIEVLRIAPLGDPMKIKALGYKLSLRLSEAAQIEVVPFS